MTYYQVDCKHCSFDTIVAKDDDRVGVSIDKESDITPRDKAMSIQKTGCPQCDMSVGVKRINNPWEQS